MSAAKKWAIPPGYRVLDHIVQEHGRDHTETKLLSGEWPAFRLDLVTGDLYPIPITTWGVYRGHNWLEKGASGRMVLRRSAAVFGVAYYAVIVRVSEQPPSRMNNPKDLDGPKVRKAKALMKVRFPRDEWRLMKVNQVEKALEPVAKAQSMPAPKRDTVARAMGRRRRK